MKLGSVSNNIKNFFPNKSIIVYAVYNTINPGR